MTKIDVVVDCADPEKLAAWWEPILGYTRAGGTGQYVALAAPPNDAVRLMIFQGVPEAKAGKNRVHFDVLAQDIEGEAARLEGLGAKRVSDVMTHGPARWIVMNDPEGNEFCVCRG